MIKIYGKENCPRCVQAKKLCEAQGKAYEYFTVGEDITREELIELCPEPVRTVPQIFDSGEYVGGADQLIEYLKG